MRTVDEEEKEGGWVDNNSIILIISKLQSSPLH